MKGCLGQLRDHAGRNVSERRAGLEKESCGSRPDRGVGKAAIGREASDERTGRSRRGNGGSTHGRGGR